VLHTRLFRPYLSDEGGLSGSNGARSGEEEEEEPWETSPDGSRRSPLTSTEAHTRIPGKSGVPFVAVGLVSARAARVWRQVGDGGGGGGDYDGDCDDDGLERRGGADRLRFVGPFVARQYTGIRSIVVKWKGER